MTRLPFVNFIIGAQDRFLLGSTVRLNGKFTAYNSANQTGATLKGATPNIAMEPRLGVFSVIDSLAISSAMTTYWLAARMHPAILPAAGRTTAMGQLFPACTACRTTPGEAGRHRGRHL
eukprot:COSAG05_NODE_72_length_21963_cov_153.494535_16_plen_119_part_00